LGKKLRVLSGDEVCVILEGQGYVLVRQHGSHMIMQRQFMGITQTVPVPNHKELDRGTLAGIIALAGVARALFEVL
jgi:predicted RNA binding protein YcfA (HicA-like mRNA interferase family)